MDKYFIERVNSDNATLFCFITILTLQDYNLPSNDDDILGEDLIQFPINIMGENYTYAHKSILDIRGTLNTLYQHYCEFTSKNFTLKPSSFNHFCKTINECTISSFTHNKKYYKVFDLSKTQNYINRCQSQKFYPDGLILLSYIVKLIIDKKELFKKQFNYIV